MVRSSRGKRRGERGVVLGIAIITSVIFGIAAFGLLSMAVNQAAQTNFIGEDRIRDRYVAESGLVNVMQRLWTFPAECGPWSYPLDTDDNGVNDATVTVTAINCPPAPAGSLTTLQAKVTF